MFCVSTIFLTPDLRVKPYSVVILQKSDLAVNYVHRTFSAYTRFLPPPDFSLLVT